MVKYLYNQNIVDVMMFNCLGASHYYFVLII